MYDEFQLVVFLHGFEAESDLLFREVQFDDSCPPPAYVEELRCFLHVFRPAGHVAQAFDPFVQLDEKRRSLSSAPLSPTTSPGL
jgi:hypothetical protein